MPETFLDPNRPLPFCPGCGHSLIVKAIDKALVNMDIDPAKVVIVTDIGCVGLSDLYFKTSGFHGLHGRSITYATGLKLADPDLKVIVLMGDGGCGIGGTHLLNAARRNVDITVIIFNNFNYGMTGGEHSVTTPMGGITNSTPGGNQETPMDICATLKPSDPSLLIRHSAFDKDLPGSIEKAVNTKGFCLLDVWELCMAYYGPKNDLKRSDVEELMDRLKMPKGIIHEGKRPRYDPKANRKKAVKRGVELKVEFQNELNSKLNILIAGGAGQKIASSATNLGRAGIISGLYATQKDDYPITVMTGYSNSEMILSPERIELPFFSRPDCAILLKDEGVQRAKELIQSMDKDGVIIADEDVNLPDTKAKVHKLPLMRTAKTISRLSAGSVGIGALVGLLNPIPLEAVQKAIELGQKPEIASKNIEALKAGYNLALDLDP